MNKIAEIAAVFYEKWLATRVCTFWIAIWFTTAPGYYAFSQDGTHTADDFATSQEDAEDIDDIKKASELPAEIQTAALALMDELIDVRRREGYAELAAAGQAHRDEFPENSDVDELADIVRGACETAGRLRDENEMLAAQRLLVPALTVARDLEKDYPKLVAVAYLESALLDVSFERYEQALVRLDVIRSVVSRYSDMPVEGESAFQREFVFQKPRAHFLHLSGKYGESARIYSELLDQVKEHPNELEKFDVDLRICVAELCADATLEMFRLWKNNPSIPERLSPAVILYNDILALAKKSGGLPDLPSDTAETDPYHALAMNTIGTKMRLAKGDLESAAKWGEGTVEFAKRLSGVSSDEYVKSIELLARVRTAQEQPDKAVELLIKSAEIRARLFGPEHPSVSRIQSEVDELRHKKFIETELPPWSNEPATPVMETADRYAPSTK